MGPSSRKKQLGAAVFALGMTMVVNPGVAAADEADGEKSTQSDRSSAGGRAPVAQPRARQRGSTPGRHADQRARPLKTVWKPWRATTP